MIEDVIDTNDAFRDELDEIEQDLIKSSEKKQGKNPGIALRNLFTKWADEPYYTQEEFNKYKNELWMSLQQFEEYLREQEYSMEIENRNLKIQYRTRVDGIRA